MELLSDPLGDRVCKSMLAPPQRPLSSQLFFKGGLPNHSLIQTHLFKEGRVLKQDFGKVIRNVSQLLSQEPMLLQLKDPVTVVGDIHGQFYDLLKVLQLGGSPQDKKYIFMGDYVDRGCFSIQVLILLYSLKVCYPKNIFLLRGNHETRQLTTHFNFRQECLHKFDQDIYELIIDSFNRMPVACILNNSFFIVHGGISPHLKSLQNINSLKRGEPQSQGLFCDLLWADPFQNQASFKQGFANNSVRGCSYYFNKEAVQNFLFKFKLVSLIRAHQAQLQGYKTHWPRPKGLPQCMTIFSAPNYCDCYKNKGAIVNLKNNTLNIKQYVFSEHPYHLPNFMNIFEWSIPFVAQKVSLIFLHFLKTSSQKSVQPPSQQQRHRVIAKIKAVTRILIKHKKLKQSSEKVLELKGFCPDNKLKNVQIDCREGEEPSHFEKVQSLDQANQKIPIK